MGFSLRPMLMLELASSFEGRFLSGLPGRLGAGDACALVTAGSLLGFSVSLGAAVARLCLLEAGPRVAEGIGRELFRFTLA